MNEDVLKWLEDIRTSIESIDVHLQRKRDFHFYTSNLTNKRAVEREIEIIGEAVNRILKTEPDFPISHARIIVGLRNRVIHGYDTIDDNLMWRIVVRDIPTLKNEVELLLKRFGDIN